jgi:hypothetical protein
MDQTLAPPAKSASPAKRWAALAVPLLIWPGWRQVCWPTPVCAICSSMPSIASTHGRWR